jgi:hypothetical protein
MRDKYTFIPDPAFIPKGHKAVQRKILLRFVFNKYVRKSRSDKIITELQTNLSALAPGTPAHPDLFQYEKSYLQSGGDWAQMKVVLQALVALPDILAIVENAAQTQADINLTIGGVTRKLGIVYLGAGRFELLAAQPAGVVHNVYVRRGDSSHRHYVQLTTTPTFVKRFVTRGLNASDAMRLTLGQSLEAPHFSAANPAAALAQEIGSRKHPHALAHNLSESEQILSHTRGWRKRYISTGVSNRPVYSTRGTQFQSMYGTAIIDLAIVPQGDIFDLHTPETAQIHSGLSAITVTMAATHGHPPTTHAHETFLGLRDILRTRELLIKGSVPFAAVLQISLGQNLVGISSNTAPLNATVPGIIGGIPAATLPPIIVTSAQEESPTYTIGGLRWHFYAFPVAANAALFAAAIGPLLAASQNVVSFNQYATPAPTPAGMV